MSDPRFIQLVRRNAKSQRVSLYACGCGREFEALEYNVASGHTQSCGCLADKSRSSRRTHGESRRSTEYRAWAGMKSRCNDPGCSSYPKYGARGIRVCERWQGFENFLEDIGRRPSPNHSLERIDNDGDYEPSNVRWATSTDQARNRRTSRIIEFGGKRQCLEAWADDLGICQSTLHERLNKWPLERALTQRKHCHV
jgi:hypothetical protein